MRVMVRRPAWAARWVHRILGGATMMGWWSTVLRWPGGRGPRAASAPTVEYVSLKHGRVRLDRRDAPRIVRQPGVRPGVVPGEVLVRGAS
jgi:hypothetical protein